MDLKRKTWPHAELKKVSGGTLAVDGRQENRSNDEKGGMLTITVGKRSSSRAESSDVVRHSRAAQFVFPLLRSGKVLYAFFAMRDPSTVAHS